MSDESKNSQSEKPKSTLSLSLDEPEEEHQPAKPAPAAAKPAEPATRVAAKSHPHPEATTTKTSHPAHPEEHEGDADKVVKLPRTPRPPRPAAPAAPATPAKPLPPTMQLWRRRFLTWFGDLKWFKFPPVVVWDPGSYRVKGDDVRELLDLLRPGDILLRSYDNYLDGLFMPGDFSHVGIYFGDVAKELRKFAGTGLTSPHLAEEARRKLFRPGKQRVIHAMAEGVFMEDILQFCRCDQMLVLRLPEKIRRAEGQLTDPFPGEQFSPEEEAIRKRLAAGEEITRQEVIPLILRVALSYLGEEYDFGFDFECHRTFSCSEFAYWCYRSLDRAINLQPKDYRILMATKKAILPDDLINTQLEIVWRSRSVA